MKRSTKQMITAILIGLLVVSVGMVAAYIINSKKIEKQYVAKISSLETEIQTNKKYVYKAINPISAGDILEMSDLEFSNEYYSLDVANSISEEDIGKRTLIPIAKGQAVLKSMIEPDLEFGLREMEYNLFRFNSNIVENDLVDIRLALPNGEDLIVIPKTILKNVDLASNKCNLWLDEEEILNLSSAIVDASNYDSAYLYTAKYIDAGQDASVVTYHPDEDVMLLIANDPNVLVEATAKLNLRARKELEERLNKSSKEGKVLPDQSTANYSVSEETENTESLEQQEISDTGETSYSENDNDSFSE